MTVSNHRPYTYPDGRIDIPSAKQHYTGGVKYTDFAINEFINKAKTKLWFNSTLFVIVSDHCSKSAGKTDLPVNRYHIPCLIYAPLLIKPAIEKRLVSQIDLAPTVLGFLNQSYQSKFLGSDVYKRDTSNDRLFISTYQDMGYIKNNKMVILSPRQKIQVVNIDYQTGKNTPAAPDTQLINEAIAWYNGASYLYKEKKYKIGAQ
jgi:phosphoglycerol transferase MdoB-like AlkP superfamily enzyme